jgi:hypothetical protein
MHMNMLWLVGQAEQAHTAYVRVDSTHLLGGSTDRSCRSWRTGPFLGAQPVTGAAAGLLSERDRWRGPLNRAALRAGDGLYRSVKMTRTR